MCEVKMNLDNHIGPHSFGNITKNRAFPLIVQK